MMPVTSDRKISSNRKNAQKSTGPKSVAGRRRIAQNALRHGLAIPVSTIVALQGDIEALALSIARATGTKTATELSQQAAEAQLEILRIRRARAALLSADLDHDERNRRLASLERYERRAFSRRKQALRGLE